jgi:hypothetical protein
MKNDIPPIIHALYAVIPHKYAAELKRQLTGWLDVHPHFADRSTYRWDVHNLNLAPA